MHKLLLIDNNFSRLDALAESLRSEHHVIIASDSDQGLRLAGEHFPDLVFLEVRQNGADAHDFVHAICSKAAPYRPSIIMSSAFSDLELRLNALEAGADDFLVHPYDFRELLVRIKAVLRRGTVRRDSSDLLTLGNLVMNRKSFRITINGEDQPLTQKQFALLEYFCQRPNQAVSRKELLKEVWMDAVVSSRTIDTHLVALRRQIDGFSYQLEAVHGVGYILCPPRRLPRQPSIN